jgi:hypothetical protein
MITEGGYPYQCQASTPAGQRCPAQTTTAMLTEDVPDLMLCDEHATMAQEMLDATADLMRCTENPRRSWPGA